MLTTTFQEDKFRLPDFIVPGAAKSGTTTLYRVLAEHPDIFFPKNRKEPFYFSFGGTKPQYSDSEFNDHMVWDTQEYLELYRDAPENQLAGDASTSYLYTHKAAINNMRDLYGDSLPKVKVIIILRNPAQRAYSHYTYLVRNGFETREFAQAILPEQIDIWKRKRWGFDYIAYSMYADAVKAYRDNFDDVLILLTEDLKSGGEVYDKIFDFLGLPHHSTESDLRANPSGVPKSRMAVDLLRKNKVLKKAVNMLPEATKRRLLNSRDKMMAKLLTKEPMAADVQARLTNIFADDVERLERLTDRDLTSWKS